MENNSSNKSMEINKIHVGRSCPNSVWFLYKNVSDIFSIFYLEFNDIIKKCYGWTEIFIGATVHTFSYILKCGSSGSVFLQHG